MTSHCSRLSLEIGCERPRDISFLVFMVTSGLLPHWPENPTGLPSLSSETSFVYFGLSVDVNNSEMIYDMSDDSWTMCVVGSI